jgi:hypothetical protein
VLPRRNLDLRVVLSKNSDRARKAVALSEDARAILLSSHRVNRNYWNGSVPSLRIAR